MNKSNVILAAPVANVLAINRVLNELGWGGDNLSAQLSASGSAPATHKYCNITLSAADKAAVEAVKSQMLTPAGGWPLADGVTQADAEAGVAAMQIFSWMGVDDEDTILNGPSIVRPAMLQAMGLKVVVFDI